MKLPPLNALRVFETAARKGSFVAAGDELGVTSAAVSLQVRSLENWLGRALFFRRNNQIRLTDAGEDLYRNAAQSLAEIAAFTQSVQNATATRALVVSAVPSLAERWLIPALATINAGFPIKVLSTDDPVDLERAGVDIHISYGGRQYPDHIKTALFTDAVQPMAAPQIAANLTNAARIEIDWGRNFTSAPRWSDWYTLTQTAPPATPPNWIATSTGMALTLAEQGAGIVLGQVALAHQALAQGKLVALDPRNMPLPAAYFAITGHHQSRNSKVQTLLRHLKSAAP
ncbi:LysR family transcriptional regulator [Roseobacter sp. N2S]|uniref:LysR family transcriptional regulator n=1 Tax=Roseobacter sp. N2S TaxID=2663844 RepID=UPI00285B55F6|nr:LysR family transcriptional regulator [Roseobacter sp. N2S]MDR6267457.1 LysR family glycine cleavage system transcriptional activator [Roseobacter sp. N2S]